jgi:hypothetical protein
MAACEKNLRHYARVLRLVQQYQAEGAGTLSEKDRRDAADLAQAIKVFVSTLRVDADVPGAKILVDDREVATTPADPVLIDMGEHRVKVTKPGFADFDTTIQASGASEVKIEARLVRNQTEPAPRAALPSERGRSLDWGLLVGGSALGLAGGVLAFVETSRANAAVDDHDRDTYDAAKVPRMVGIVAGVGGVAVAGVGATLLLTGSSKQERSVAVTPWLGREGAGAQFGGSW